MKKTFLTLATACTILFATACNSDNSTHEGEMAHDEMTHDEMMHEDGSMNEGEMEHQEMANTASGSEESEVTQFQQVSAAAKTQIQQLTNYYLDIKNALVAGKASEAQSAATKMIAPLEQFNATTLPADQQELYKKHAANMKEDAEHIIETGEVSHQRDHFATLSKSMYELNKAFAAKQTDLYYQHCPMAFNNKGGYWLSAEKEIRNPYFGDKMLKCGRVTETL